MTLDAALEANDNQPGITATIPLALDMTQVPAEMASTLQYIVGELSLMSQTLGLVVERLTMTEDKVRDIEKLISLPKENKNE